MKKTAFISIVGRPNVGKSSLLNKMLGHKIAIVSHRPQTTRTRIMGVLTNGDVQLVFTDTPGFHRPQNKLGEKMVKAVSDSISDVDMCLFVCEPGARLSENELELLERLRSRRARVVLAVNKIDLLQNKNSLLQVISALAGVYDFQAIVPVSAVTGDGVDELIKTLESGAQESEFFFPPDALTDQPERVLAAEMIREKLLKFLNKEVPHGTAVSVERMKERPDGNILDIDAFIYCEKESHKGIIIGKNGLTLKRISTEARLELEKFFDCKVFLTCRVKVKQDWRNREGLIHNFGLD